ARASRFAGRAVARLAADSALVPVLQRDADLVRLYFPGRLGRRVTGEAAGVLVRLDLLAARGQVLGDPIGPFAEQRGISLGMFVVHDHVRVFVLLRDGLQIPGCIAAV